MVEPLLLSQPCRIWRSHRLATVAQASDDEDLDAVDQIDLDLFPIFEEEAVELFRNWGRPCGSGSHDPKTPAHAAKHCVFCIRLAVRVWLVPCAWAKWRTEWSPA